MKKKLIEQIIWIIQIYFVYLSKLKIKNYEKKFI